MMMTMKKMKMMMMRRKDEDEEDTLIGSSSSSPDLETLVGPPSPWSPDLRTRPRRNLIRRIADAVAGLARSVTATVARTPDKILVNNVSRTNCDSDNATENKFEYDVRKCVVGSERAYCRNCSRYHHALVAL